MSAHPPTYTSQLAELYTSLGQPYLVHNGVFWHRYQYMAEPRHPLHHTIELSKQEAIYIRKQLNARLIRWTNPAQNQGKTKDSWYAVVCKQNIDLQTLKSKRRRSIEKALESHELRRVPAVEMAKIGFPVYQKAVQSYGQNAGNEADFIQKLKVEAHHSDLIHYLGVFREGQLVAYSKCYQIGQEEAIIAVTKYDPDFLKFRISEALTYYRNQYFLDEGRVALLRSGFRRLAHETNVQDFYSRFNFERMPLDLQVQYQFPVGLGVKLLKPFGGMIKKRIPRLAALIEQDHFRL